MKQMTLATAKGFEVHGRAARKAEFLARMETLAQWAEFCASIEPRYPKAGIGRPLQRPGADAADVLHAIGFNLADQACELRYGACRDFCGIDLGRSTRP